MEILNENMKQDENYSENPEVPVKLIERTLKYKGAVLTVYDDYVDVKGHKTHWDFIHHMGASAVLPVLSDGRLLLVKQYRHALGRFTLEIPAGKRDSEDELFSECAMRELEEETGYKCDDLEFLMYINTTVAFLDEKIGVYVARNLKKGQINFDEDEEIFLCPMEIKELNDMIYRGLLTDGKTVAAIMAYQTKYLK